MWYRICWIHQCWALSLICIHFNLSINMFSTHKNSYVLSVFLIICNYAYGQQLNNSATWCTVSKYEQHKCEAFARAIDREIASFGNSYISLKCKVAFNKEECMTMLDHEKADLTTLDAGEVFIAGRYHSLVPIAKEIYDNNMDYQYAVAVVKKGTLTDITSLRDLRGKKACFAGVGTLAGWVIPIHTLMKEGGMEVIDCNNHVKSAIQYFGPSCAVNSLTDKYNPLGDNSNQLCKICGSSVGIKCTDADPFAGYEGAFRCLVEAGDIAFLRHTTVQEMTSMNFDLESVKKDQFELFCRDGSRKQIDEYANCNWGTVPSHAVVTSSATSQPKRKMYQRFLERAVEILGKKNDNVANSTNFYNNQFDNSGRRLDYDNRFGNSERGWENNENGGNRYNPNFGSGNTYDSWNNQLNQTYNPYFNRENASIDSIQSIENFNMFESANKYGIHHNLLFSDITRVFMPLPEKDQTYSGFLRKALDSILAIRQCPVNRMTLCVTSDAELEKCVKMKIALKAQLLKPDLQCYQGQSHIQCMRAIQNGNADVTMLDAGDIYTAGLRFGLIPFLSEVYNLGTPDYYVVAVAKEEDDNTDLTYLKNKYTCHPGIYTAAGWIYPLAYLLSNNWIRGYGCDSVRAAAEYFTKSCVPGALSVEYNTGVPYENLCRLCHGTSKHYCERSAFEDYYGYTGAFRCLVEGGGDVAFVKHTTVSENTDGKRREFWARNAFTKDFQLLCPDGTRKSTTDYMDCNLGKVMANAAVTRGGYYGYNETEINAYINLFIYAQQFYGKKEHDEFSFSMFYSTPPYSDLIFQDAAQQLDIIPKEKREYSSYLGQDFMKARRITDCKAGTISIIAGRSSVVTLIAMLLLIKVA